MKKAASGLLFFCLEPNPAFVLRRCVFLPAVLIAMGSIGETAMNRITLEAGKRSCIKSFLTSQSKIAMIYTHLGQTERHQIYALMKAEHNLQTIFSPIEFHIGIRSHHLDPDISNSRPPVHLLINDMGS